MRSSSTNLNALGAWMDFAAAYGRMSLASGEVIARRSQRLAMGAVTPSETVAMVLEKATVFAAAAKGAAVAAARGGDAAKIARAALRPYGAKTRSNARKLRR